MTGIESPTVTQQARPVVHFTPRANWMNDPNGLLFHGGRYHLFFQYNPEGLGHGSISWGHASSPDLLTWREHPLAISFDEHEQIFSGSAVVDETNSSGFGDGTSAPLVAVYTSAQSNGIQAQSIAYSIDAGETWQKYEGNPVLDRGSADFRDPKVFRYQGDSGAYWVMVAVEATEYRVLFYRSDDLKDWSLLSSFGPDGAVGGVWECPDLFPLSVDGDPTQLRWVLIVSMNPGGVAGGSGTRYIVGDFDGTEFVPDTRWPLMDATDSGLRDLDWLDWGRDCYAGVTFNGLPDDERTLIAWMSNWDYARDLPTDPWRGSMTLARHLSLVIVDGRPQLRSTPVVPTGKPVFAIRDAQLQGGLAPQALPVPARITIVLGGTSGALELELVGSDGAAILRIDTADKTIALDRRRAFSVEPNELFASVERFELPAADSDQITVEIVTDHGSIEVFAADGVRSLTDVVLLGDDVVWNATTTDGVQVISLEVDDLSGGAL